MDGQGTHILVGSKQVCVRTIEVHTNWSTQSYLLFVLVGSRYLLDTRGTHMLVGINQLFVSTIEVHTNWSIQSYLLFVLVGSKGTYIVSRK